MRLNLGCGLDVREGWVNIDCEPSGNGAVVLMDVVKEGILYDSGSVDFIFMGHMLHMVEPDSVPKLLGECHRVLRPGGALRIVEMDFEKAIVNWQKGNDEWFPVADEIERTLDGKLLRYLTWHGTRRSLYTPLYLFSLFTDTDFEHFGLGRYGDCELDARESESVVFEAIK